MNWQKQMEDMVAGWTDTQRRLFDQWMDAVRDVTPGAEQWQKQYHQQLDAWEQSVREALARQQEWASNWSGASLEEGPGREAAQRWLAQTQEMMQGWTDSQRQLWDNWMEQARKAQPMDAGEMPWQKGTEEVVNAWRDASVQAEKAMQEWTSYAEKAFGGGAGGSTRQR